jgi:hypothetical protein
MSARRWCFLLATIVVMVPAAFGQPTIVNFDFGAVRIACGSGYAYESAAEVCTQQIRSQNFNASPGFGWILGGVVAISFPGSPYVYGGAGLTAPDTIFCPPSFSGLPFNQAVFLQDRGSFVWQGVGGFTAGNYTLSFYLGSRCTTIYFDGNQTVEALIDGSVIASWALTSDTPFALVTAPFTVTTDGSHTLEFRGLNRGDHTAFMSYVIITPTGRPKP